MRPKNLVLTVWLITIAAACCLAQQQASTPRTANTASLNTEYGNLPLQFEANQGQSAPGVSFLSRGRGYSIFLTSKGMVLAFQPPNEPPNTTSTSAVIEKGSSRDLRRVWLERARRSTAIGIDLVGAKSNPVVVGEQPLATKVNYFIGRDPSKWQRNVPTFRQVRYTDVYPGIDLVYYGKDHQLEYDFSLRPGADPSKIQLSVRGADAVELNAGGDLVLKKGGSTLQFKAPAVFEEREGGRKLISGSYVMKDSTHVGFVVGPHNQSKVVVIDPVLVYSTFLGGSNDDFTSGIAVDGSGDAYVVGLTDSPDFPMAAIGSYNPAQFRLFLVKLDPSGTRLLFADYFGGTSGNDDVGAIALDSSGNAYVAGTAASADFPVVNAYQSALTGTSDAFLSQFSADGSSLLYSSYLGGSNSQTAYSLAVDAAGEAIVGGATRSTDFPTVNAFQSSVSQDQFGDWGGYGFLTKFSAPPGKTLVYSTYLGGSALNAPTCSGCFPESDLLGVATDVSGNAYVAGYTNTTNFPVTAGSLMTTFPGPSVIQTGFVSKFTSSGRIGYSTYLPGPLFGNLRGIAADSSGAAYVTGFSTLPNSFPVTNTALCNPSLESCEGIIVAKLNPSGSSFVYSTYLGSNYATSQAILLDANGDAFILGGTDQFALSNSIEVYAGNGDVAIAEIDPTANTLLMSTFLGGQGPDGPSGFALDPAGAIYVTGLTQSVDFPVTQHALQTSWGGNTDAFITKIDTLTSTPAVAVGPWSLSFGSQYVGTTSASQTSILRNMGSAPLTITDRNTTGNAGDFAENDDCGGTVAAASFCTLTFTFTPTASGSRSAAFIISDSAVGSPHTVTLTGSGTDTNVSVSPTSLSFPDTTVGSASSPQAVTFSNTGSVNIVVSSVQVTGDFLIFSDNCTGNTVTPTGSCTVQMEFTPTTPDQLTGTLQFQDSAASSPQTVTLNGTGLDFSMSSNASTATIQPGGTATYSLSVSSNGDPFTKPVGFSCIGVPSFATCTVSPSSIMPDGAPVTVSVSTSGAMRANSHFSAGRPPLYLAAIYAPFALFGLLVFVPRRIRRTIHTHAVAASLLSLLLLTGCVGTSSPVPARPQAGTYTFSVVASSGTLHHVTKLTLVVQ